MEIAMDNAFKTFRDLIVWQKAMRLVTDVYRITRKLPKEEQFGLTSQLRRAAVSVPSNIAEGYGRNSNQDFIKFLRHANGSLFELQTQLIICLNLEFLNHEDFQSLEDQTREVERMNSSLINAIQNKSK